MHTDESSNVESLHINLSFLYSRVKAAITSMNLSRKLSFGVIKPRPWRWLNHFTLKVREAREVMVAGEVVASSMAMGGLRLDQGWCDF